MLMSKDLKQETLLESQAELEQENEETEEGCLYSAAVAILQEKTFETLDNEGLDEALSVLDKFYTQYEVVKGFQYNSLKASLILKGLNAMNSIGELSSIDANAAQADITELISLIENEEDVDADYLSSLLETYKDELEQLKAKFAFVHDFNEVDEKIQELRTPEKIITDSKVNDAKKALALWDDFYKRNERDIDDAYFEKAANIYNAFFYALTIHKNELESLSESQLSHYSYAAKSCVANAIKYCEHEDSKDEWLALQERISEQVEELKKLHEEK